MYSTELNFTKTMKKCLLRKIIMEITIYHR